MPYCAKDPKRDHHFDHHPYALNHIGIRIMVRGMFLNYDVWKLWVPVGPHYGFGTDRLHGHLKAWKGAVVGSCGFLILGTY